jgi:hypothetical protein
MFDVRLLVERKAPIFASAQIAHRYSADTGGWSIWVTEVTTRVVNQEN